MTEGKKETTRSWGWGRDKSTQSEPCCSPKGASRNDPATRMSTIITSSR